MKPFSGCPLAILPLLTLSCWNSAFAQVTPSGDASTFSGSPATNYGASTLLNVTATQTAYIQFDLASIPFGAVVSQATLKLYVNSVSTGGSFDVDYVGGAWSESTLDYTNAPPLGNGLASNVAIADANQYILINITLAMGRWPPILRVTTTRAPNNTGIGNAAYGCLALQSNTSGTSNAALGGYALKLNTTGFGNTANGSNALAGNTTGGFNTANGIGALLQNTSGANNTADVNATLQDNTTGNLNTAVGSLALGNNTTGNNNTASGFQALTLNATGSDNIAIGYQAAYNAPAGNSDSIYIGSQGSASDASGTIRIGTEGAQKGGTFIAGIYGASSSGGAQVYVNSNGHLGTVLSSRRFKADRRHG